MGILRNLVQANRDKTKAYKNLQRVIEGAITPFDLINMQGRKEKFSPVEELKQYKSWAYTCANRNAVGVAKGVLRLYAARAPGEGKSRAKSRTISLKEQQHLESIPALQKNARFRQAQEVEEILAHPFLDLMGNVNEFDDEFDLKEKTSLFLDVTGDSYWHIVENALQMPMKIFVLPSQLVRIVPDRKKFVKGYLYGKPPNQPVKFLPREIIHHKRQNPNDPWYGMSRIEGAYWALTGYESMEHYEKNLTDNRAIPDMIIKYKKGMLSDKQRRDLLSEWNNALQGLGKVGGTFIADESYDVTPVSFKPREIAFLKGREWHKGEIVNAFGQHEAMYTKNANTANIQGAIYLWEQYEITPTLRRLEEKINAQLIPRYNEPRLFVAFDVIVRVDKEEVRKDDELLMKYGYPLNRILMKRGLDPVEGGDVGYIPLNSQPLGSPAPKRDEED